MRIERIELSGVGPFEDTVLEIPEPTGSGELVLFEGPNGSGKTTILQAIALAAAAGGDLEALAAPFEEFGQRFRDESARAQATIHDAFDAVQIACGPGRPSLPASARDTRVRANLERLSQSSMSRETTPWAAFAFRGHVATARLTTEGPKEILSHPLQGALSFGVDTRISSNLGQLLINLEYDRVQAKLYASESSDAAERERMGSTATSRARSIARFSQVLSRVLDRSVEIEFGVGIRTPRFLFDGQDIPLDVLGEGFRNTVSWLGDLCARLERTRWAEAEVSPYEQDFWLILDEVEESLHPTMQARILPALRELFPNAHIYASTHSPFVVASAAEGFIFPIRPGRDHQVRGKIEARPLEPGQSLEWVTTEIFGAQAGFVDQKSRDMLQQHKREIRRFQRSGSMDWEAFFARRAELMKLNDEVRTIVAMQEVPVRREIDEHMLARDAAPELGTGT